MHLDPEALVRRVRETIELRGPLAPGLLVVAVSGGQDSICMLDVLRRLQDGLKTSLHVAHLNHGFRGAQAAEEAEYVRELAARWQLPATIASIDVPAYRARHRLSKQVGARYARYRFLCGLAHRLGAAQIAVGHTADDAVESLLINLLRGSGLAGLRGIDPSRRITPGQLGPELAPEDWRTDPEPPPAEPLPVVVRPMLDVYRAETEAYCAARGLRFWRDPSNEETTYRRSWVRARLLPMLEEYAPGARERLRSAADLLADDYRLVSSAVQESWERLATVRGETVEFRLEGWGDLDIGLRRHLLRRAVETVAGSLEEWGRVHVDAMDLAIRESPVGARLDLPGGVRLEKGYASFRVVGKGAARAERPSLPAGGVPLPVPGRVELPEGILEAELTTATGGATGRREVCDGGRWEACLDADVVGARLVVRGRSAGDRFVPLGMERPKKLHDFMVDEKIPREERDRVPLVSTPDRIVWVVGYRIDDRSKVTPATRRILWLRYTPAAGGPREQQGG